MRRYSEFQAGPTTAFTKGLGTFCPCPRRGSALRARAPEHLRGHQSFRSAERPREISLVLRHRQLHTASPNGCSPTEESALRFARTSVPAAESFAARDLRTGESIHRDPLESMHHRFASPNPYPGCPYSVTLAAAILTERDAGSSSRWAQYVASLPKEVVGYANCNEAYAAGMSSVLLSAVTAVWFELQKYASLVIGSHAAIVATASGSTGPAGWNSRDWIWAMSQVHSRTFGSNWKFLRVEQESVTAGIENRQFGCSRRSPTSSTMTATQTRCAASGAWNAWSGTASVQTS